MYLSIYPSIYLSIPLSLSLSVCLSVCLSTCLSARLKTKLFCETSSGFELAKTQQFCETSSMFELDNVKNKSNSARLLQFSKLTTSKKKQFCETSSIFQLDNVKKKQFCETSSIFKVDNIKNEAILRDFLQKWKVACSADGLVPMSFAICPIHLSKLLRLPRKSDARSYEVLHLSRKITSENLKIWCSKMQPLSGNQGPDLLTALMKMSLVLRLPRKMHLCRSSSNVPRLPSFVEMRQNPHVLLTFDKVHNPLCLLRETSSEPPKVERTCGLLYILTSKCASRHNGMHFFDISTSKSGPHLLCFVHFDFEICFAPQRRALFRHLNFQKCSERDVLLAFSLANVLRATTACNFSSLIWPDGSAPAALASLLFDPPEPQIIGKTHCLATFLPFRAPELLSSDPFSSLIFSLLLFSSLWLFPSLLFICLSILSEVWLLNFLRLYTSRTTQGGGGSFKHRKPIGDVGCCESGMAERSHWWTERCLRSPLFLSFSLCFSIFLWLSTYLPADLSVYLSICLSVYLPI